nr:glycosyltransferase family 2 protein [Bacteroides sp.]
MNQPFRGGVKLSIIIVSYNTKDVTRECLKSIQNAEWRDTFEIIVVDNNSSDGSVEMIRSEFPEVKVIANPDNRFFAIANNQGAAIAKGEYLLLLNSDTLVYGDNLQKMIDFFDTQSDDVICIGPKILNKDKSLQSCGVPLMFNPYKHVVSLFCLDKMLPLYKVDPAFYRKPDKTHQTGWVSGACMMIPAKKYTKVGGMNENLVFYGEEPEFGYRTSRAGYKTIYYSDAEIIHLGGVSAKADKKSTYSFEKDIREYDSLITETVGTKRAITITRLTRFSLMVKWLFYKNKNYVASRIKHEKKVMDYFKKKLESNQAQH